MKKLPRLTLRQWRIALTWVWIEMAIGAWGYSQMIAYFPEALQKGFEWWECLIFAAAFLLHGSLIISGWRGRQKLHAKPPIRKKAYSS